MVSKYNKGHWLQTLFSLRHYFGVTAISFGSESASGHATYTAASLEVQIIITRRAGNLLCHYFIFLRVLKKILQRRGKLRPVSHLIRRQKLATAAISKNFPRPAISQGDFRRGIFSFPPSVFGKLSQFAHAAKARVR